MHSFQSNICHLYGELFLFTLIVFFVLFIFRHLCITRQLYIFVYHTIFVGVLFVGLLGGGGALNDGYRGLEKFIVLEKNNQLVEAKRNLKNYDSILAMDLQQFQNSDEFRSYLKRTHDNVDTLEAIFLGWLFVLISDIAMMCVYLIRYVVSKIRNRFSL